MKNFVCKVSALLVQLENFVNESLENNKIAGSPLLFLVSVTSLYENRLSMGIYPPAKEFLDNFPTVVAVNVCYIGSTLFRMVPITCAETVSIMEPVGFQYQNLIERLSFKVNVDFKVQLDSIFTYQPVFFKNGTENKRSEDMENCKLKVKIIQKKSSALSDSTRNDEIEEKVIFKRPKLSQIKRYNTINEKYRQMCEIDHDKSAYFSVVKLADSNIAKLHFQLRIV